MSGDTCYAAYVCSVFCMFDCLFLFFSSSFFEEEGSRGGRRERRGERKGKERKKKGKSNQAASLFSLFCDCLFLLLINNKLYILKFLN